MSYLPYYRTLLCRSCGFAFPTATSERMFSCPVCGTDTAPTDSLARSEADNEFQGKPSPTESALAQCRTRNCQHFPHGDCCGQHRCPTVHSIETVSAQVPKKKFQEFVREKYRTILVTGLFALILFSLTGIIARQFIVTKNTDNTAGSIAAKNTDSPVSPPTVVEHSVEHSEAKAPQNDIQENSPDIAESIPKISIPEIPVKEPAPTQPAQTPAESIAAAPVLPLLEIPTLPTVSTPIPVEIKSNPIEVTEKPKPKPQEPLTPQMLDDIVSAPKPEKTLPPPVSFPVPPLVTHDDAEKLPLDSAEKILERAKSIAATEPEKCLKELLLAVKRFREQNTAVPESVYYLMAQTYASLSWGQPFSAGVLPIESVSVSPDNTWMLTQHQEGAAQIWNLPAQGQDAQETLAESESVRYIKLLFSPDQRFLFGGGEDGTIRIWSIVRQRPEKKPVLLRETVPGLKSIQLSPNGQWLMAFGTGSSTIFLWDLHQFDSGILPSPILLSVEEERINVAQFSPDSQTLAVGGQDSLIRLYDLTGNIAETPPQLLYGHQLGITALSFAPNGSTLASGGSDNKIILWNLKNISENLTPVVLSGHLGWVNVLVFDSTGSRLFSGSYDNTIRIWTMKNESLESVELSAILRSGQGSIRELLLSSDGKNLVSLGNDGSVRIQNTAGTIDPELSVVLRNRSIPISCAALTSDNRWLVFGYENLLKPSESGLRLWGLDIEGMVSSLSDKY